MMEIPCTACRTYTKASILVKLNIRENRRLLLSIHRQTLKFDGHVIRRDGFENDVLLYDLLSSDQVRPVIEIIRNI